MAYQKINFYDTLVEWRDKFNSNVDESIDLKNRVDALETGGTTDGELIALRSSTTLNFTGTTADERVEHAEQEIVNALNRITALENKDLGIYNVRDFGAVGDGVTDDSTAIQAALDAANAAGGGEVYIPDGVYAIKTTLLIYSYTRLRLAPGATLIRAATFVSMLRPGIGDVDAYDGAHDIEIMGGTWDLNARQFPSPSNAMIFGHCRNIVVRDAQILDCYQYHGIEYNAVQNGAILNCLFKGYSGTRDSEAIQIDLMKGSAQFGSYGNYDNTPCDNILIAGCVFEDWSRGVGSHSSTANVFHTSVRVIGNHFRNMSSHGVFAYQWRHFVIANNTIESARTGIEVRPGRGTDGSDTGYGVIKGNVIRNINGAQYGHGIWLNGDPDDLEVDQCVVTGNLIDTTTDDGILIQYGRWNTIANNHVRQAGDHGIQIYSGRFCQVIGNLVRRSWNHGIVLNTTTECIIQGNLCENNQQAGPDLAQAGIRLVTDSNYNNVQGNICRAGTNTDYGIYISGSCVGNLVTNNDLYGGGKVANLDDRGVSTVTAPGNRT